MVDIGVDASLIDTDRNVCCWPEVNRNESLLSLYKKKKDAPSFDTITRFQRIVGMTKKENLTQLRH